MTQQVESGFVQDMMIDGGQLVGDTDIDLFMQGVEYARVEMFIILDIEGSMIICEQNKERIANMIHRNDFEGRFETCEVEGLLEVHWSRKDG